MAEAQLSSLTSFKKQFDDQLTCGVCLDQYTNPKLLSCYHTFCLNCIQQLPIRRKEGLYYISCPTCRSDHLTPEGGFINLPHAFQINSLLDLRKKLVTSETVQQTLHPSNTTTCAKHNDLLTFYCETCFQIICRNCTISEEHNMHKFSLISECYPKHHQQLLDSLNLIRHKAVDTDTAISQLANREREVLQQGQQLKEQINTHTQQIIDQVQRSQAHLLQQVHTIVQQKKQVLTAQRQQAQKIHAQLKTCQEMIEHSLKEWTQQQILTEKHTMMDEMNNTTQKFNPSVFQPIEIADIKFKESNIIVKEIGLLTSTTYGKATLKVPSPILLVKQPQPSTATLTLCSHDGSPFSLPPSFITSTLSSPSDGDTVKCNISQTHPGKYNIAFTPSTRGAHILTVQVGGVDIPDSPFTLPVIPSPEMRGQPVNIIMTSGLEFPHCIAVFDNGNIVLASYSDHIIVLDKTGIQVKSFHHSRYIAGVAISNDRHILLTSDHQLQKLTTDGVCVKSVGSCNEGNGSLEFYNPEGIAVHSITGQIFVADRSNNRIQVFTRDLTFSHTITHKYLILVTGVALDSEGYLYAYDHYIIKFTTTGQYIKYFALVGKLSLLLTRGNALNLTIHNNLLYVSENNSDRVSILDTNGKLIYSFKKTEKCAVLDHMATDTLGNLYICDRSNHRIVVY